MDNVHTDGESDRAAGLKCRRYTTGESMASQESILELLPSPGDWTEAEYFPLADRGRLVELSDGELEVLPLPTWFHQSILLRLSFSLHAFVIAHKLGLICFAPLPARLWPGKVREPDLMFMSAEHQDRIDWYWGVPDLAVEIISEGTEHKDRVVKRSEYAQAGILEYWIIDPEALTVEQLRLQDGAYAMVSFYSQFDTLTSPTFPGWSILLDDLFAKT